MKTAVIASPLIASDNLNGSIMGMDAAGMSQATYFMRDKIYSNKILAVVREYACNAIDEHAKHSVKQAVEIGLRKDGEETIFFVRDFANGLSDYDVRNVFGMYFRSTKTGTNESIGGFGIGSKAGHCYNDTFFVTSYFQGKKSTYACMLGGGDTGVPVGHIYEIDNATTAENGLEVSMPINDSDRTRFEEEIKHFVEYCPANIVRICLNGSRHFPSKTVVEHQINEFNFRLVESPLVNYTRANAILQMGGVNYGTIDFKASDYKIKSGHSLIINLPIGSMSIPISRESFEDTPNNNKIRARIKDIILDMAAKDLEKFKDKTIIELVNDSLSSLNNKDYAGEIFCTSKARLFKDVWPIVSTIRQSNSSGSLQKNGNKIKLVTIPNNYAEKYWVSKLMEFSKNSNRNYYFIGEYYTKNPSADLLNEMELVAAKKLDYPRVKRDNKTYAIATNFGNLGAFSAIDLHNHAVLSCKLATTAVSSEKDAKAQVEKYINNLNDTKSLMNFVIANRTFTAKNPRLIGYYSSSQKFVESMKTLGWLEYGTPEYRSVYQSLFKKENEKAELLNAVLSCKRRWLEFTPRTRRLIESKPKNALRIVKFWQEIRKEETLRSKMIMSFDQSGYNSPVYSRKQFRTIMNTK